MVIPNNRFVADTVTNLNFMRRYIAHSFTIVREADDINLFEAKELIFDRATEYCSSFSEVAERYNGLIEKRLGIILPGPEPSVRITTTSLGKNELTVTKVSDFGDYVRVTYPAASTNNQS